LSPETVAMPALVDEAVAMVAGAAHDAQLQLTIVPPADGGPQHLHADHRRVRQVLVNPLGNAVKYNRPGGQVTLRWEAAAEPDMVCIEVADTGQGLTGDQLAHLFEPFNRLGAERSQVQGTGIGLVVTQRLTHLMGGRIQVHSEPGAGSRFSIVLPAARDVQPPVHPPLAAPVALLLGDRARWTVLYVEDNPMNVELVRALMHLRPSCRLVVARSGHEALELARAEVPDLLLLDMHLGDMTGLELHHRLSEQPGLFGVPRIAISADAMPAALKAANQAGFSDYLTKPLDVANFLACLDRFLDSGAARAV
jgi:CheY-like chemotaxis protein